MNNKIIIILIAVTMLSLSGCAGYSAKDNRNMAINAAGWGAIGAAAGGIISEATGGEFSKGAAIGGVAGAAAGAANTPLESFGGMYYHPDYSGNPGVAAAYHAGVSDRKEAEQRFREESAYQQGRGYFYYDGYNRRRGHTFKFRPRIPRY